MCLRCGRTHSYGFPSLAYFIFYNPSSSYFGLFWAFLKESARTYIPHLCLLTQLIVHQFSNNLITILLLAFLNCLLERREFCRRSVCMTQRWRSYLLKSLFPDFTEQGKRANPGNTTLWILSCSCSTMCTFHILFMSAVLQ